MISPDVVFPQIADAVIEERALSLLHDFYLRPVTNLDIPIPVERIAEQHLNYEIDIVEEAPPLNDDILGGILFIERIIQVTSSVSDHEGRYNFTIAHEIGHHVLHRQHYLEQKPTTPRPTLCRQIDQKPAAEKQADRFAAALLMPAHTLTNAVTESGLKKQSAKATSVYDARNIADQVRKVGNFSNASNTAVLNRMIDLQYITKLPYQNALENHQQKTHQLGYARTLLKKFLAIYKTNQ